VSDQLPAPLVHKDCNLRDFPFMPLEVERLRRSGSWLYAKRNPSIAFYLINLWTASWHEVPAGSIEDNDDVLADFAMCEPKKWDKLKADVLRGWVKCSDGRLYHPVVCEKVSTAWAEKMKQRGRTDAARLARLNKHKSVTESVTEQTQSVTDTTQREKDFVTGSKG